MDNFSNTSLERAEKFTANMADRNADVITDAGASVISHNFYPLLQTYLSSYMDEPKRQKPSKIGDYMSMADNFPMYRTFIQFNIYRISKYLRAEPVKNFECDCSKGATDLYSQIYSWLKDSVCETVSGTTGKYQLRQADKGMIFKGDTMTSVFTPLKEYMKLKYEMKTTSSPKEDWETYWLESIRLSRFQQEIPGFVQHFILYAYSFANFLPVPQGFNTGRSNFGKWDSWDLTLNQIYQWYMDNPQMSAPTNDRALEKLFIRSKKYERENTVSNCARWLKSFYSWENFVEQNYMESFVLPDGQPKRFFKNHTLEYGLPKTLEEYEEFFKNAVSCIKERAVSINKLINAD